MSEQHQKDRIFAFQLPNLTKNFGFVMGIEFREGSLSITPSCHAIAAKGMVFNVNIGLSGLVNNVLVHISLSMMLQMHTSWGGLSLSA
jgi:nucleosome binding factor SPN SPT16 subunit